MLLVTPSAAAEFLHVSKSTLAKLRVYGGGPKYRKHGRSVVYEQIELERWSNEKMQPHTSGTEYPIPKPKDIPGLGREARENALEALKRKIREQRLNEHRITPHEDVEEVYMNIRVRD